LIALPESQTMNLRNMMAFLLTLIGYGVVLCGCAANADELIRTTVGEQQIVFPAGYHGLKAFPDEPIAILNTKPFRYLMVAAEGTYLMEGESLGTAVPVSKVFAPGPKNSFDSAYAGITSVYRDPRSQQLLGLYHAEDHEGMPQTAHNPEIHGAYWSIGLAVSKDQGRSFQRIGQVLASSTPKQQATWDVQGVGDVCMVTEPTGTYLFAYFTDLTRRKEDPSAHIGLARCRIADGGSPGTWWKYHQGKFGEKGIGGDSTAIVPSPGFPGDIINPHVTYLPGWKQYLMVCNVVAYGDNGKEKVDRSGTYFCYSEDGITWSVPQSLVLSQPIPYSNIEYASHPSLYLERFSPHEVQGWLLYCYSPRWGFQAPCESHHLARRRITFTLPRAEDAGSSIRKGDAFQFARNYIETPVARFAPVTLEAWIIPSVLPPSGCFIIGSDIRGSHGIGLALNGPNLAFEYLVGFEVSNAPVPIRQPTHVAAVFGAENTRLYRSGKLVHTGAPTKAYGDTPFVIGQIGATNPDLHFVGQMRCVRISKGERYTKDFTPAESFTADDDSLVIYDGKSVDADRVIDLSGKGNHGKWR